MRILHLTDLHVTEPNETLRGIWSSATAAIGSQKVDFVVVSGDLTQSATKEQFDDVATFLEEEVLRLLVERDRRRIIIVPGNHDLSWDAVIGDPVNPEDAAKNPDLAHELDTWAREPQESRLRFWFDRKTRAPKAHLNDPRKYPDRFSAFDTFIKSFYPSRPALDHAFELATANPQLHWSAHVFMDQQTAFFGFSSCHGNDAGWTGASISNAALEAAEVHAKELREKDPDITIIAVWHHGMFAERGRPDHLVPEEVGKLANTYQFGLHGHTHEDDFVTPDPIRRVQFPIIATGSFGAGTLDRPGGVRNQFSVVDLTRGLVRRHLFEREKKIRWRRHPEELIYALRPTPGSPPASFERSRAKLHERVVDLDNDGIARVQVRLEKVSPSGKITLVSPNGTYNRMLGDAKVRIDDDEYPVSAPRKDSFGRVEIGPAEIDLDVVGRSFDLLRWDFDISNAFALSERDLRLRAADSVRAPEGYDTVAHVVRFQVSELRLVIRFPAVELGNDTSVDDSVFATSFFARVDQPTNGKNGLGGREAPWKSDDARETERLKKSVVQTFNIIDGKKKQQVLTLAVSDPIPGYRYVLCYRPVGDRGKAGQSSGVKSEAVARLTQHVLSSCQDRLRDSGMVIPLETAFEAAIKEALGVSSVPRHWVTHLWSDDLLPKGIVPAFGRFPPHSWSAIFAYGEGIAGHAYRRQGPAAAFLASRDRNPDEEGKKRAALLYREPTTQGPRLVRPHEWILCLPILVTNTGPTIGVLGFADAGGDDGVPQAERVVRELAEAAAFATDESDLTSRQNEILNKLSGGASVAFWQTLSSHGELYGLPEGSRALAEDILNRFWTG